MDRGTWIALGVMVFASIGVTVLLLMPENSGNTTAAPTTVAAPQDCQSTATAAAARAQASSGDTTSVVEAHLNVTDKKCYYEVTVFGAAGTMTAIKVAPNDQEVALCTTSATNALSCKKGDGSAITEPQFKALLTTYFSN